MDNHKENLGFGENTPDPEEIRAQYAIEDDSLSLEPLADESEHREINADNPSDLQYWANQFQISVQDLKAAIALNGNSVREIKKYLSV